MRNGFQPTEPLKKIPTFKRKVVFEAYVQTSYEQYTHIFKTVEINLPDDGIDWHVTGELKGEIKTTNG